MTLVSVLLVLAGSLFFYLCSSHQHWRQAPLGPRWRALGWLALALGLLGFCQVFSLLSAIFSWASLVMLTLPLVALSGLLRRAS
ncbi:hypothetical protein [Gallaecimonas xiamenensis]|uniref:Uncharacterized protein n=1 Tax=Gallaecimonas xiamenensis 3-C-1 TaxID=745411 RepID=K2IFT1_9GAMM|nr:hypothetical protein [Gallaecimonas xiamenensis]EKE68916.1 hypothetical protein B3C1_16064 [Gallaecimonas xiamenensis 3-C-1]